MTFDINSLAIAETSFLQLKHPATDEPLFADAEQTQPVGIKLYSTGSKQYRAAITAMQNRALKRNADKRNKPTAADMRAEGIDLLASVCIEAENFSYNGMTLDNKEAFRTLFEDDSMSWCKEQVDSFLADVSNFIKA